MSASPTTACPAASMVALKTATLMSTFVLENVGFRGWKENHGNSSSSSADRLEPKDTNLNDLFGCFDAVGKIYPPGNNHISQYSTLGSRKIIFPQVGAGDQGICDGSLEGISISTTRKCVSSSCHSCCKKNPYHSPHMLDTHFFSPCLVKLMKL